MKRYNLFISWWNTLIIDKSFDTHADAVAFAGIYLADAKAVRYSVFFIDNEFNTVI